MTAGGAPLIGLMAQQAVARHPDDPVVVTFALVIAAILFVGACASLWINR